MQTKCPHCQTVFKVSDEHLKAADGYVRCGICKEVFNALEDKSKKQPPADTAEQPKTNTTQKIETPVAASQKIPTKDKDTSAADKVREPAITTDNGDAQVDMFTASQEATKPEAQPEPAEAKSTASKTEETAPAVAANKPETKDKEAATTKAQSERQTPVAAVEKPSAPMTPAATPPLKQKTAETPVSTADNNTHDDNLFDGVQSKLIPDEYRIPELHNTYSIGRDLAWSLAILALTASLFIEYAWFNRNELIRDPQLRPMVSYLCSFADCNMMNLREPDKIEMTTRNIYTHPNVKNALMISGTLINHADFEQAYPNILIDFSDVRGEVIASRTFTPEDYLQIKATSLRPLPPELPIDFNIEIKDPGKNAMTYEFTFM